MLSNMARRWPLLAGRNPPKRKESVGRPLATRAERKADWAGNGHHRNAMADGERDQPETRIADAGRAGIGNERDRLALLELHDQLGGPCQLIVLVIAGGALFDCVMIEQLLGLAGVLAGDEADLFQNAQGSKGNVFEVADWGADQVKGSVRLSADRARVWRNRHPGAV